MIGTLQLRGVWMLALLVALSAPNRGGGQEEEGGSGLELLLPQEAGAFPRALLALVLALLPLPAVLWLLR